MKKIILICWTFFACLCVNADSLKNDNYYTLTESDVTLNASGYITACSYNFQNTNIVIPSKIGKDVIKGIADGIFGGVFEGKGIAAISLPLTFEKIGIRAFKDNKLTYINITGLTKLTYIGSNAFSDNSFNLGYSITLPNNSDPNFAAWYDSDGTRYGKEDKFSTFSKSVKAEKNYCLTDDDVVVTEYGTLNSCSYDFTITDIEIPDTLDNTPIQNIYSGIFNGQGLTTIILPTALYAISSGAFKNNNLESIDLSQCLRLQRINSSAFANNLIDSILLPSSSYTSFYSWRDAAYNLYSPETYVDNFNEIYYYFAPYTLKDEDVWAYNCGYVAERYDSTHSAIIFPDTLDNLLVREISTELYSEAGLLWIKLPSTLKYIHSRAFYRDNLKNIDFTELINLEKIYIDAFTSNNLTSLDLSKCTKLELIDMTAFFCNEIASIDISGCYNLTEIGYNAFAGNVIDTFALPYNGHPDFACWKDSDGNFHNAGSNVPTEGFYYKTVLNHILTFNVDDGYNPIENAYINIASSTLNSSENTNENGSTAFQIRADTYVYTVSKQGYEQYIDTIVLDQNTTVDISLTESSVPEEQSINGETFDEAVNECFNAWQSIVVAEYSDVSFEPESNTELIAGHSIRFLPGTLISSGAYVHAYITSDSSFCTSAGKNNASEIAVLDKSIHIEKPAEEKLTQPHLKVYPNPNNGHFTIEATGLEDQTEIAVYNLSGLQVYSGLINNSIDLNISVAKQGIYIVKTLNKQKPLVQKMLVQ